MSTTKNLPLAGKVALVTGGSRSMGAAIVRRLAADGAAVAIDGAMVDAPVLARARQIIAARDRLRNG